jgi:uncharacterized protein YbjT (DUF2867 family)
MKNQHVLVIGGKGKTGRKVVERLEKKNVKVRIGSRSTDPSFDWNNPDTWEAALEGSDTVYITYQPDLCVPAALPAIKSFSKLAVNKGIRKMVILSGRGEKEAQACEEVIMNSGVNWTVVRCDWFHQNFSENFFMEPILAGHVALPQSDTLIPFIDTDDIADVAAEALVNDSHNGVVHELTGSELLTFKDVVQIISRATGRKIAFQPVSLEEYLAMMREMKVPEDYIWLINYLFTHVLDGRNSSTTDGVERALGRKPKTFKAFAEDMARAGVWDVPVNA